MDWKQYMLENILYFSPLITLPASALGDSMDQLSQRSSSERTQFMSREDLDQEGSLDLDHDHYHYHDEDQDQYIDQELEQHGGQDHKHARGANISTPTKTLELKVQDKRTLDCWNAQELAFIADVFAWVCSCYKCFIEPQPWQLTNT